MSYIKNNNSEQEKNLNEKDKRDIEFIINDIKSGKKLLNIVLSDYIDLLSKENKLQCISGYTIDRIIELFLNGFVFVNEGEIKDEIRKKVDIFFDNLIFAKDINELKQALKEELLGDE